MAVDLEHHNFRSFLGITCLIQISTRDRDFIIDPIKIRSHIWILNEVLLSIIDYIILFAFIDFIFLIC